MTVAPDVPRLAATDPSDAIRRLRKSGLRLSTARRLIIEALFAVDGPVAAQELAESLSLDESSVYRNLELLERQGLTRHVHLGHGPGLYALVGRDDGEYLYCERCAKVTLLASEELDPVREQIRARFGYQARFTHFAIVGLCEECVSASTPRVDVDLGARPGVGGPPPGEHRAHLREADRGRHQRTRVQRS
jgi:Fur family ferric uptake transcriptional regulator